jgi:hypothetical protein
MRTFPRSLAQVGLSAFTVLSLALACSSGAPAPDPAAPAGLLPASSLQTDCFDWPARDFNRGRHADVGVKIAAGDRAVDFTLRDTRGREVQLAELLKDKPVLLVQGSWTCPRFQEERAGLEQTMKRFRNELQVVHVYNIEAHPAGNDPGPYKGRPSPKSFSDRKQPRTYDERLRNARDVARDTSMPVVVDALEKTGANPIWCTYGTCASCSWLIRQDGMVEAQHEWHDQASMEGSIEAMLASTR